MKLCPVCEWRWATRRGRCHTCYVYWRRTGKERSDELVDRHAARHYEKRLRAS